MNFQHFNDFSKSLVCDLRGFFPRAQRTKLRIYYGAQCEDERYASNRSAVNLPPSTYYVGVSSSLPTYSGYSTVSYEPVVRPQLLTGTDPVDHLLNCNSSEDRKNACLECYYNFVPQPKYNEIFTMKLSFSLATLFFATQAAAFAPGFQPRSTVSVRGTADDLGIPCEDECAIEKYPNLPESIHPGVLTGQAQMDLLQHAKENGKKEATYRV